MTERLDAVSALNSLEQAAHGFVRISALQGGWFTLPTRFFVSGVPSDEKTFVPSLSFLLTYNESTTDETASKRILFDLGLRREPSAYVPQIQNHLKSRQPIHFQPDVRQSLLAGGLEPSSIDEVILSHVHWDHIGTPSDFPHAKFFVGAGALQLIKNGLNGHMSHSHFQQDLFDGLNASEFPDPAEESQLLAPVSSEKNRWKSVAGLKILDHSGNGNTYIVDTPGHLTGHISLLARIGPRRWALLIGDACHDLRLLTGDEAIAEWSDAEGRTCCIHMDKDKATETLGVIREWKDAAAQGGFDLQIVFAHDANWINSNPGANFPGTI